MIRVKHKLKLAFALIMGISIMSGCESQKAVETMTPLPAYTVEEPAKFYAPYTGEEVTEEVSKNIAFMAIIENSKAARPQSGLSAADIVYETMAEGGIPRFIALFQKNNPAEIGPIRSARPYFIDIAREYNLAFGHCGYSSEAKAMIEENKLMSLNEFFLTGFYWRDKERKAPHNLYTSAKRLRDAVASRNYVTDTSVKLKFNKEFWTSNSLPAAEDINLNLNKYYSTSYFYHDGKYYKSMDDELCLEKEDDKPITVSNLVIQITTIKLQEDKEHLDIALTGEGTGYVFSNGRYTKMKWYKKDTASPTILKDENGLDIPFSPGNTWWHIIDKSNTVEIK